MTILIAFIGWFAGVLINYLSDVLPNNRRLAYPLCAECGNKYELINYFLYPRKCHRCQTRRTLRSWIVEVATPLCAIYFWYNPTENLGFLLSLGLLIYFFTVIVIDIEHHLILHQVSLIGALLGIAIGIRLHGALATILGWLSGSGTMFLLYLLGILFSKYVVHKKHRENLEEALGFGDVILSGILGLILGFPGIMLGLFLAILLGGFFSFMFILINMFAGRYRVFTYIPYGPFLVIGSGMLLFFKQYITSLLMP